MIKALGSGVDIFLQPGDWYFSGSDTRIRTTLGSCVAVTLWHPQRRIGGMCHYMLPRPKQKQCPPSCEFPLEGRYAEDAMQLLASEVKRHGSSLHDYQIKLFGGANMFAMVSPLVSRVALQNIEAAHAWLFEQGVIASAESVGGVTYRQLRFDISTGSVWVRQGHQPTHPTVAATPN